MPNDTAFTGSIPELYDRCMGPMIFEPFARDTAARFAGFSGDLLEVAAGTGRLTRALASAAPGARITATDLNPSMLAEAARLGAPGNVEFREADALDLPFPDAGFDAVVCQFGVMFYPDKVAGHREARRVLRPGGRYLFSVWDDLAANDISMVCQETVTAQFPADPPRFYERTPFGHHDREEMEASLRSAGFGDISLETVRLPTPAASSRIAAQGLCMGSPLAGEIEDREPGGLARVTGLVAQAIADRFAGGDPDAPIVGTGQAVLATART
jgi:ubiquinone/menaquinone biosynthesis C-methylase UbiE